MTLRLILTRHAKSSWDNINQPDHERPLNPRGRASAMAIGAWLVTRGYVPDRVLCSTATRTRETCALVLEAFADQPEVDQIKELYHAASDQMLAMLQQATGNTVLLIGHNPGCAQLATELAQTPPAHNRFSLYPTAATTVYDFDAASWADIGIGQGVVRDFTVPRDLGID